MTVFAGIISFETSKINGFRDNLEKNFKITTKSQEIYRVLSKYHAFFGFEENETKLKKLDKNNNENFCWISGKAIFDMSINSQTQESEIILNNHLNGTTRLILKKSRGVYSGCVHDEKNSKINLFTDKLGIRPIYIYQHEGIIIYSSVLSIIKALPFVNLTLDETNTTVLLGLGFCLGNTTPYKYIQRLEAGEIFQVEFKADKNLVSFDKYWSYRDDIEPKHKLENDHIKDLYDIFKTSVFLRSSSTQKAVSFLSGGMDSRAVTAIVNSFYNEQITFNYSKNNSQDQSYARKYAKNANLIHHEQSFNYLANPNWSILISKSITKHAINSDVNNKKTCNIAWSGDGGSVGLGMVYITKKIEESLANNDLNSAINHLIEKLGSQLPVGFIKTSIYLKHKKTIFNEIKKNLLTCDDPLKSFYLFLLYNDQKRHMDMHFESICEHGIEFELPFFDSAFLSLICSLPTKEFLYHKAYSRWFELFPEYVTKTPWQTYPEHITCPLESNDDFSYQWSITKKPWKNKLTEAKKVLSISNNSVTYDYLDKTKLRFAAVIHSLNIRDYSYIMLKAIKLNNL